LCLHPPTRTLFWLLNVFPPRSLLPPLFCFHSGLFSTSENLLFPITRFPLTPPDLPFVLGNLEMASLSFPPLRVRYILMFYSIHLFDANTLSFALPDCRVGGLFFFPGCFSPFVCMLTSYHPPSASRPHFTFPQSCVPLTYLFSYMKVLFTPLVRPFVFRVYTHVSTPTRARVYRGCTTWFCLHAPTRECNFLLDL